MASNVTTVPGSSPIDLYLANYAYNDIVTDLDPLKIVLDTAGTNRIFYRNASGLLSKLMCDASTSSNHPENRVLFTDANGNAQTSYNFGFDGADAIIGATGKLEFRDSDIFINSTSDGYLSLNADVGINLNSNIFITGDNTLYIRNANSYIESSGNGYLDLDASIRINLNAPVLTEGTLTLGDTLIAGQRRIQFYDSDVRIISDDDGKLDLYADVGIDLNGPVNFGNSIYLTDGNRIQFRDSAIYIHSSADGYLDLFADISINLHGNTAIDGSLSVDGDLTVTGSIIGITYSAHAPTHEEGGSDEVDHNELLNYEDQRHIDHSYVTVQGSGGLSGGGTINMSQALYLKNYNGLYNNLLPKWDSTNDQFVNSQVYDNGTGVGIGTMSTSAEEFLKVVKDQSGRTSVFTSNSISGGQAGFVWQTYGMTESYLISDSGDNYTELGFAYGEFRLRDLFEDSYLEFTTYDSGNYRINLTGTGGNEIQFEIDSYDVLILGSSLITAQQELRMENNTEISFRENASRIYSSASGYLDLIADTRIHLRQDTYIFGDLTVDGTLNVTWPTHASSHESGNSDPVDHDTLANHDPNEHIDHSTLYITAGDGLTGGGDLTDDRTIDVGAGYGIAVASNYIYLKDYSNFTNNYVMKWNNNSYHLENSQIYDNGTDIGIGTSSPSEYIDIRKDQADYTLLHVQNQNTSGVAGFSWDTYNSNNSYLWTVNASQYVELGFAFNELRFRRRGTNEYVYIKYDSSLYKINTSGTSAGKIVLGSEDTDVMEIRDDKIYCLKNIEMDYLNRVHFGQYGTEYISLEEEGMLRIAAGTTVYFPTDGYFTGDLRVATIPSGTSAGALHYDSNGYLIQSTSDKRLKNIICKVNNSLENICKLNPVKFNWKTDKEKIDYLGFIAQEVKEVIPEATFTNRHDDYMGVHDSAILANVVGAIKELNEKIKQLESKLSSISSGRGL